MKTWSLLFAMALVLVGGGVQAQSLKHGTRPVARTVYAPTHQPDFVTLVSSDLGLHISFDGGETFYWMCEDIIGYDVQTFAVAGPVNADVRQRTWLAGGQGITVAADPVHVDGIYISHDGGCNWTPPGGVLAGQWVSAISVHPDRLDEVLVSTQHVEKPNGVAISSDAGATWEWTELRDQTRLINAMLRAPSDPERVYAAAEDRIWRSDDGGHTWPTSFGDDLVTAASETLTLAAISPDQPDLVWFFVDKTEGRALYVSPDGGQTHTLLHQAQSREKASMAVVSDGESGTFLVMGTVLNYYYFSADGGEYWEESEGFVPVECLVPTPDDPTALYVCSNIFVQFIPPQIALGVTTDHLTSISPYFTYGQTADYLQCDDQSQVNTVCIPLDTPNTSGGDAGLPTPDVGSDTSGDDAGLDAGPSDGGTAPGVGGKDDCGCGVLARPATPGAAFCHALIAALLGLSWFGRRRRRA